MHSDEFPTPAAESPIEPAASDAIAEPEAIVVPDMESDVSAIAPVAAPMSDAVTADPTAIEAAQQRLTELQQQEQTLRQEIAELQAKRNQLHAQTQEAQAALEQIAQDSLHDLQQRKQALQISVEQLERRQERIRNEMRTTFAGASQDIAIRVQSFKDYLVGSLQDLAIAAERLELAVPQREIEPPAPVVDEKPQKAAKPSFAEQSFEEQTQRIRKLIDQFRNQPDYYGPPWKLRRTFEPIHAERVTNWFFSQGGRGAVRSMGSRLQNILVASAAISILYNLYGDDLRTLVLANSPERLGEWRRGLQDCLGVARGDFGADRGLTLFESPEALAMKAERLEKDGYIPLIVIDETEDQISLAMLQFPLWLAFAPSPQQMQQQQQYLY